MSENNCYLCQEPKSVVGHNTQSCPSVKCKKCGQNGHIIRNCPNFNSNMDQKSKSSDTVEPKMSNENHETKTLDLKAKTNRINSDEFIFYANPKINLGSQKVKASTDRINSDEFQEYVNPIIDLENISFNDFQGDENSDISPAFDSSDIKKSSKNPPGQIVISNEIQKPVPDVEKGFVQENKYENKESNALKLIDNYKSSEEDALESDVKGQLNSE